MLAYAVSKSVYIGMIKSLAIESNLVRVNGIAPGWINTPMLATLLKEPPSNQRFPDKTPLKTIGTSKDFDLAAIYVSSQAAKFALELPFL